MTIDPDDLVERRNDAVRRKLIDAGAERLAIHGYGATSLVDIAVLAGVDQAMVSYHFPTKEDMVEAVLREGIDYAKNEIDFALEAAGEGLTGANRLAAAMRAYLKVVSAHQHVTRANIRCYRSVPPVLRRGLAVHMREFVEIWTELLEEGAADGSLRANVDTELIGRALIAALNSAVTRLQSESVDPISDQLVDTMLEGLRAEPTN